MNGDSYLLDTNSILVTSDKQLLNSNLIKTIEIKDLRIK
jgi:hypothetical protein